METKSPIDAGREAAEQDIAAGRVTVEIAEEASFDAEINCSQHLKAAMDNPGRRRAEEQAAAYWSAYGSAIDNYYPYPPAEESYAGIMDCMYDAE